MPIDSRSSNFVTGSTAFETIQNRDFRNIAPDSSDPSTKIDIKLSRQTANTVQFPSDLGKYQFLIIESEFVNVNDIQFQRAYKLPIPTPLHENYSTNYDHNFNLLDASTQLVGAAAGGRGGGGGGGIFSPETESLIGGLIGPAVRLGSAALGLSVNQFKTVTLSNPSFRTHELNWKFSPKTFDESRRIREIIFGLKKGMAPRFTLANLAFAFPKVYSLMFIPNMHYLYKFKPCVLQELLVDYQGGNPAPAFYNSQGTKESNTDFSYDSTGRRGRGVTRERNIQGVSYKAEESPPESVVIKTRWLELEYWSQQDFERGGVDSADPFDVYSWYRNNRTR